MKQFFSALALGIISTVLLCLPLKGNAIESPGYKERTFNKEELEKAQNDSDYKYAQPARLATIKKSLWDRIGYWIDEKIEDILKGADEDPVRLLLVILAVGLIIFFLANGTITGAIGIGSARARKRDFIEENIHAIDFDKAISEAIAAKEFRLATRLYFLKTLKTLDDRKLITHSRDKTNRQYLYELKNDAMRNDFRWLMRSFEFIWYGNAQPGQTVFQQVQLRYMDFLNQVEQSKKK